jgi:hypothetical protein
VPKGIDISDEMITYFIKRTKYHTYLVHKYLTEIMNFQLPGIDNKILDEERMEHDESKFDTPELIPYLLLTWRYLKRETDKNFDYPKNIQDQITKMTEHHVRNSKHHPEYWTKSKVPLINPNNRDAPPDEKINCYEMPLSYVACMVADWKAMSEEKETDAREWADKNIDVRWLFSDKQKELIYNILEKWAE